MMPEGTESGQGGQSIEEEESPQLLRSTPCDFGELRSPRVADERCCDIHNALPTERTGWRPGSTTAPQTAVDVALLCVQLRA